MARSRLVRGSLAGLALALALLLANTASAQPSAARTWNEQLLAAIRLDRPRPPVHARNLYHVSAAMYDAWAAYDLRAAQMFHHEHAAAAEFPVCFTHPPRITPFSTFQRRGSPDHPSRLRPLKSGFQSAAAAWSAPWPLSEASVALSSAPVQFPDFTRGGWRTAAAQ